MDNKVTPVKAASVLGIVFGNAWKKIDNSHG
jgi:hypothetical protein